MIACSYCSVSSPQWWTTAAIGRGSVALLVGIVMAVGAVAAVVGAALMTFPSRRRRHDPVPV